MRPRFRTTILDRVKARAIAFSGLLVPLVLVLVSCESPIHVAVDVDRSANLVAFESYAWISAEPLIRQVDGVTQGPRISPIDDQRIRAAVDGRLAAKGWKRLESPDEADLVVSYGLGAQEKTDVYATPTSGLYYGHYGYGRHGYGYGGGYGGSIVRTKQYTEGTLTVEFFDRRTKQAAWVGWASKRLSKSRANRQEVIDKAVAKILTDFPSPLAPTSS